MGAPVSRWTTLIPVLCYLGSLRLASCEETKAKVKNITWEARSAAASNDRGEYACADFRHLHISNPPLSLPNVTTLNGQVRGIVIKMESGREVYGFLGIPFAKPPIGELRFKEPLPADDWKTYDAVELPPACSQIPATTFPNFDGETTWNPNTKISEDCLYLNIWVSADTFKNALQNGVYNATVMFWIYGGAFMSGTSTLDVYNGSRLADESNVIVVSAQYRVGPFGFLYFGNEYAPGNMGLWDQNLALRWVHKNIERFGGDKDSICLFGQSAGAASVTYHLLSSYSQPFIKRAILMSGTALSPWAFQTSASLHKVSRDLVEAVGCGCLATKPIEEIVECLRKVDPDAILKTQVAQTPTFMEYPYVPTVDGKFLPDTPRNMLASADLKKTDIIIGNTQDEGTYFTQYQFVNSVNDTPQLSLDEFVKQMSTVFERNSSDPCRSILNFYTNWKNLEDLDENRRKLNNAVSDYMLTCPSRAFADAWSKLGNSVYYYFFTQRTSSNPWPSWMGVVHADDIEYAFGLPIKSTHTDSEKELAHHIVKLFTNFANTGTPSPNWMPYTSPTPLYLNLNATVISDANPSDVYGPRPEQCAFWNRYEPASTLKEKYVPYVIFT